MPDSTDKLFAEIVKRDHWMPCKIAHFLGVEELSDRFGPVRPYYDIPDDLDWERLADLLDKRYVEEMGNDI